MTAVAAFRAPIEAAFDYIAAEDTPPKMMLGYGPVPGVARRRGPRGPLGPPRAYRTVHLEGGGTAREEITAIRGRGTSPTG